MPSYFQILISFILGLSIGLLITIFIKLRSQKESEQLKLQIKDLEALNFNQEEKYKWLEQSQEKLQDSFQVLAGKIFREQSEEWNKQVQTQVKNLMNQSQQDWNTQKLEIKGLVEPLKENLNHLDGHIRALEQKRQGAYESLQQQIKHLAEGHSQLQSTTLTLSQALKSSSIRGRWGEIQLRRVVEMAGMTKHISFEEQVSTQQGRPDMIIHLPNKGILPVDSKVPLEAYLEAMETQEESQRRQKLIDHSKALMSRVRELSQKKYWDLFETSPEIVVMFIPSEACLAAAFENDPQLLENSFKQKILIATPVTLLALLKAVAYGWQQQEMTENATRIAKQGQELYQRLSKFIEHLNDVGKELNKSVKAFNRAMGSLDHRVLPIARRFQEFGISNQELETPSSIEIQSNLLNLNEVKDKEA
ncbi:MAG: DNA recombination protein RmuC [Deltaproteobacteria bacterium]|nr:DNA recombination protein RmuC [Deltaproteobacteria bacterium]